MASISTGATVAAGDTIVASAMNDRFAAIVTWANGNPNLSNASGTTTIDGSLSVAGTLSVTAAMTTTNTLSVGVSGTGHDVKFWGDTAGDYLLWDADTNKLVIEGTSATDALTVTMGRVKFAQRFYAQATDDIDLDAVSGAAIFGNSDGTGQHIAIDKEEIQSKSAADTAADLKLNTFGGQVILPNGSASAPSIRFSGDADTGIYMYDVADSDVEGIGFATSGTVRGTWQNAGLTLSTCSEGVGDNLELGAFGVVVKDSSSASVKNITDVNVLDHLNASMVDNLQLKMWSYKNDTSNHPQISLIAEEANAVSPFLNTNKFDEDGNVVPSGLSNKGLISLLIIALKDVRTRIAALEG